MIKCFLCGQFCKRDSGAWHGKFWFCGSCLPFVKALAGITFCEVISGRNLNS